MAIRILDKDITQRYWILQRSLGCPDQRRKGWGNDLLYEQVLYLFEGTYSMGIWWLVGTCWILDKDITQVVLQSVIPDQRRKG